MNLIELFAKLKQKLGIMDRRRSISDLDKQILLFESKNGLFLPVDLAEYFKMLGDEAVKIDEQLYQFYPIDDFKGIGKELTLEHSEECFVFADYMFHLFDYAIRLYPDRRDINEVYGICGDKYSLVANSFTEFLDLYFEDSPALKNI
jgi:hypothetical protein